MAEPQKLQFLNNQNLFSNNYLEHRLPVTALWKGQKEKAKEAFEHIKKTYEAVKTLKLGPEEEAGLEDIFIRPVLKAMSFERDVQPFTQRGTKKKRPDYALFKDFESYEAARKSKDNPKRFFSLSLTILESKYWGRRLNDADKSDILDSRDPTAQTIKYLDDVHFHTDGKINWAILTNGKAWRLFYYRAASRSGNFFEIDLEEIIKKDSIEDFLYFYLFFSKDAFISDPATGKTWLDQHLEGSEAYAKAVSERLKELIFDNVFEGLAEGFIHYRRNELSITEETAESKREIFKGCLTLLYRLLFLLYAESRNLLPVEEDGYLKASLSKLKRDVFNDLSSLGLERMSKKSYSYWARLEGLFKIIAEGDPALNVPIYNGGLFENNPSVPHLEKAGKEEFDSFLSLHKLPDYHLAQAIEDLTVDPTEDSNILRTPFIDYSSLNVRHLGDIYEGLLEFHVEIADEEMVEVKEKGKFIWKKASEIEAGAKTSKRKAKGEIYIENSKHERKATGSYYTPHYIVEYIVKNTVGPVLDEKIGKAKETLNELDSLYEKQRKELKRDKDWKHYEHPGEPKGKHIDEIIKKENEVFETLFDIKVLDPAMGSGHFLVHTVDFISDKIISFLADYPENPVIRRIEGLRQEIIAEIRRQGVRIDESKLTEVNLIKRMVMKRCVYGVDLNEMAVELAKLSLWLDSFTLGAPLSFLDHHLKCGNSLIGILDISTVVLSNTEAYSKMQRSLSYMLQVSELTDATISEAKKGYELFKDAKATIEPIRRRFDVNTAQYFADLGKNILSIENLAYTMAFDKESFQENVERCKRALSIAEEKHFFHWRLEFPEVFYTEKGEKEKPGFDCVIGNPPYVRFHTMSEIDIKYFSKSYGHATGQFDLFTVMIENGFRLLAHNGYFGFIIPGLFLRGLRGLQYESLRNKLLKETSVSSIVDLGDKVFPEVDMPTCILTYNKVKDIDNIVSFYKGGFENSQQIRQIFIEKTPCYPFDVHASLIMPKLINNCISLGEIAEISRGIEIGKDKIQEKSLASKGIVVFSGDEIDRYIPNGKAYISQEIAKTYAKEEGIFKAPKIMVRETGGELIGCLDDEGIITLRTVHNIQISEKDIDPKYILTLLNSRLLQKCLNFVSSRQEIYFQR